jgi:hypothetical protein
MAIYQLFEEKKEHLVDSSLHVESDDHNKKSSFFSTLMTRFCFLLLFIASSGWVAYSTVFMFLSLLGGLLTGFRSRFFNRCISKSRLHFCRSSVCFLSLFIGLFSPPFGIMIACTYFLMYDKAGMDEVVPASLQAQFKDIFNPNR